MQQVWVQTGVGAVVYGVFEGELPVVADACGDGVAVDGHCVQMHGHGAVLPVG